MLSFASPKFQQQPAAIFCRPRAPRAATLFDRRQARSARSARSPAAPLSRLRLADRPGVQMVFVTVDEFRNLRADTRTGKRYSSTETDLFLALLSLLESTKCRCVQVSAM